MNRAEEDYIKAIYELTIEKKQIQIKTNELSERFGYSDQSVIEMVKKLSSKHWVSFVPYKGLSLTKKGEKIAIRMVRVHRIWEVFLTKELGISWEDVHENAELLEHATTDQVLERLYQYLGEPKYCQHGNPIPDALGHMADVATQSLDQFNVGEGFILQRVLDHKALLSFLNEQNMKLNDRYIVTDKNDFNGVIEIEKDHQKRLIGIKTAKMLFGHRP